VIADVWIRTERNAKNKSSALSSNYLLDLIFAWQSGHSLALEIRKYGIDKAYLSTLQPELLEWFHVISRAWQHYLGFASADGGDLKFDGWDLKFNGGYVQEKEATTRPSVVEECSGCKKRKREEEVVTTESDVDEANRKRVAKGFETVNTPEMNALKEQMREHDEEMRECAEQMEFLQERKKLCESKVLSCLKEMDLVEHMAASKRRKIGKS